MTQTLISFKRLSANVSLFIVSNDTPLYGTNKVINKNSSTNRENIRRLRAVDLREFKNRGINLTDLLASISN